MSFLQKNKTHFLTSRKTHFLTIPDESENTNSAENKSSLTKNSFFFLNFLESQSRTLSDWCDIIIFHHLKGTV